MIDRKALTGQAVPLPSSTGDGYDFVTIMVALTRDEASLIEWLRQTKSFRTMVRLRAMYSDRQKYQMAIVQFTEKGLKCREVGKLEG